MPGRDELVPLAGGANGELAAQLIADWPAATPDLHRIELDAGRLQLLVGVGSIDSVAREMVGEVDAFLIGRVPPGNRLGKVLGRFAAADATLHATGADRALIADFAAAGFTVPLVASKPSSLPGIEARYAPRFAVRRPPGRRPIVDPSAPREAVVIGAGLAGCAVADALSATGWQCTIVDRHAGPAREASGNPAGVFHGVVHASDGPHARFNRAAALEATRAYRELLCHTGAGPALGSITGLLRIGSELPDAAAMRRQLGTLELPPDYVQALDPADASRIAGIQINRPSWFYPGGGWMRPAAVAKAWLNRAGSKARLLSATVHRIEWASDRWFVLGPAGETIASAPLLVLANADGALQLIERLAVQRGGSTCVFDTATMPLQRVRGQLTVLQHEPDWPVPTVALSGAGYLLPSVDGQLILGATSQPDDEDSALRPDDQRQNLQRLERLSAALRAVAEAACSQPVAGRTAWRCVAADRLPLVGAIPACWTACGGDGAEDQPRRVEREPGLLMLSGLGSRGLTWAPLAAQVVAALADGAPVPLPAALLMRSIRRVSSAVDAASRVRGTCRKKTHQTDATGPAGAFASIGLPLVIGTGATRFAIGAITGLAIGLLARLVFLLPLLCQLTLALLERIIGFGHQAAPGGSNQR